MSRVRHNRELSRRSISSVSAILLCCAVLSPAPVSSESAPIRLTGEDRAILAAGELVAKPKTEERGTLKLFGGQSWQVVDMPVDATWRAVKDFPRYKNIIPLATESKVGYREGNEADVAIRQQKGPIDVKYVLRTTLDPLRHAMIFRMDHSKGHDLRAGWGFLRVRKWKDDQSLVSFGAMVDIGDGMFVTIIRPAVRSHLLRIPERFKNFVEGDGRELYLRP